MIQKNCKHCGEAFMTYEAVYCSKECKNKDHRRFTDEALEYIQDHLGKTGVKKIAEHIGVTVKTLRRQVSRWRKEGLDVGGGRYAHYKKRQPNKHGL